MIKVTKGSKGTQMLSHKHKNHIHTHLGNADDGSQAMHEVLIDGNDYSSTCPVAI